MDLFDADDFILFSLLAKGFDPRRITN